MESSSQPGQIIILNGAPRAGKSSIVKAIQDDAKEVWINLGADVSILSMTPEALRPGIGLRPGGERPELEPLVKQMYLALYASIAAHSREGLNVVAEFGHHDNYAQSQHILPECAERLAALPALFVGVRCSIEEIMRRRNAGQAGRETRYETSNAVGDVPVPVKLWQDEVHKPGIYDLEVDSSTMSPQECAVAINQYLAEKRPCRAFAQLAEL